LFGFQYFTYANSLTDSLQQLLHNNKDTNEVFLLSELCWQFSSFSPDSAVLFGEKALALSKEIKYTKGIAQAYNDIGIASYYGGNFNEALHCYEQSLAIRINLGDKRDIAACYNKIGIVYQKLSKYTEALYYNILALKLFEEIGYDKGVSYGYNNVAIIYDNLGNLQKAEFYHLKSIQIKLKINDQNGLAGSYSNLANIYREDKKYDKAIQYYTKSIAILRITQDLEYLSSSLNNLGHLYILLNKPKVALPYLVEGMNIREHNSDEKALMSSYMNMADVYALLNNKTQEEYYLIKTLTLSENLNGTRETATIQLKIANLLSDQNNTKDAVAYYQKHIALKDSLFNTEVVTTTAEMQTKYETEKKEAENKLLSQQNEITTLALQTKRIQVALLIGSLAFFIVIAFLGYTRYKHKKDKELNSALIKEEQRRTAAIISAQEDERKRISAELHDGIGQMLSVVKMNMSSIEEELPLQKVKQTIQLLDESCAELRHISHHLMPAVLIQKGLVLAVQEFVTQINYSGKLHISYYYDQFDRVHSSIEINLYRILQELTNNIIKYAQATEINLNINAENGFIKVMISDNGIGFDIQSIRNSKGNGWSNIYSRMNMMFAQLEIDSSNSSGTTIFIDIPLALKEEQSLVEEKR
jgi:two-component system, NarL family, sensor kinase